MASFSGSTRSHAGKVALRFVLMIGVVSFFADFVYEGGRSITGPFLETLGASGAVVGVVAGLGELLGYGLRFFSGRISERTRQFWPMTLFGYFIGNYPPVRHNFEKVVLAIVFLSVLPMVLQYLKARREPA